MGMRPGNVGMDHLGPFWMNFRKTSEGGGGGRFPSKRFCCSFSSNFEGKKLWIFGKGGGGVTLIQKVCWKKAQRGVQRLFGSFSKIHPKWFKNRPFRSQAKPNVPGWYCNIALGQYCNIALGRYWFLICISLRPKWEAIPALPRAHTQGQYWDTSSCLVLSHWDHGNIHFYGMPENWQGTT